MALNEQRSSLPLSDPDLQEIPSSKSEFGEISEMGNLLNIEAVCLGCKETW